MGVEVADVTSDAPEEGLGVGEEEEVGAALRACSAKPMTWSAWLRTSSVREMGEVSMGSTELDAKGSGWEEGPADGEDKEEQEEDDSEEVDAVAAVVVGVVDCSASILAPCCAAASASTFLVDDC